MPAGVTWRKYITFTIAAMFSMLLGSQSVHLVYRPLDDLPELIDVAKKLEKCNDASEERTEIPKL